MKKATTVQEYISAFPKAIQIKLKKIRAIIRSVAPKAEEKISYGMPYYSLHGRLVYVAAFTDHVSLFAMPSAIKKFRKELKMYDCSKGTIRIPLHVQLPIGLIKKIIVFRMKENKAKIL